MLRIIYPPEFEVGDSVLVGPQYTAVGYVHDEFTGLIMRIIRWSPYFLDLGDVDTDDDTVLVKVGHRRVTKVK